MNHKKYILIEGNIGSGKTTLLDKLSNNDEYEVIREPVDLWLKINGSNGKNLLQEFYEDPTRYAHLFQTMVFITRLQSIEHEQIKNTRFCERSILTDRYVFGKSCIDSGKMNELEINCYNIWFDWLETKFYKKPDAIVYLRCSPNKCYSRIHERARTEESTVPLKYLQELHDYHEEWINNCANVPTLIINNDIDNNFDSIINEINEFVKNT
jgi:deoxyadenosine/deoxycytidine kinase